MTGWPLARLALVRALGPRAAVLLVCAWSLALGCRPRLLEDVARAAGASQGLEARRAVWSVALVFVLPVLVLRSAALFGAWRERERSWIGPRPLASGAALLWLAGGTWLAGVVALAATALAAELAAAGLGRADAPAARLVARLRHPALLVAGARAELRLPLDDELAARLRQAGGRVASEEREASGATLGAARESATGRADAREASPGTRASARGPALELGLRLVSLPGSAAGGRARLVALDADGRSLGELECAPDAEARLALDPDVRTLVLGRSAGAAYLVGRDSLELFDPRSHERAASLALGLDLLLAWSAWCALALALGARLRAGLASLACLALLCLPLVPLPAARSLERLVPGARLAERLAALERGLVPAQPAGRDWLVTLGVLAGGAGLALLAARREP